MSNNLLHNQSPQTANWLTQCSRWHGAVFIAIVWLLGFYWWYGVPKETAILWFVPHRTFLLNYFFRFATFFGEPAVYFLIIILHLVFKKNKQAIALSILGGGNILLSYGFKTYFQALRPVLFLEYSGARQDLLGHIPGVEFLSGATSFPSGHTISAFALYGLLAYLLSNKWQIPLLSIAVLVGISRMYLGQHFLEDVLAGAIIGLFWASLVYFFYDFTQPNKNR